MFKNKIISMFFLLILFTTSVFADVSPSGAFTYSYPIAVPPGTNGAQPNLSINYSSQGGNGMLGMGFSLSGMSAITRDYSYPVTGEMSDHFLVDGQRLIHDSGNRYRTESENYAQILYLSYENAWHITTKEGTQMYYGFSDESKVAGTGYSGTGAWYLMKVENVNRNYYYISYFQENKIIYPESIGYTFNDIYPINTVNTVFFNYENRTDSEVYKKRLKSISVKIGTNHDGSGGNELQKYNITYDYSGFTTKSRITAIDFYGINNADNGNRVTFDWSNGGSSFISPIQASPLSYGQGRSGMEHYIADTNGDGRMDVVSWLPGEGYLLTSVAKADGNFEPTKQIHTGQGRPETKIYIADVNGDGRSDVVSWYPGDKTLYTNLGQTTGSLSLTLGSPLTSPSAEQGNAGTVFYVADVNGDGRSDMVSWREELGYLYCNLGQTDGKFSATIKTEAYGQGRIGTKHYMADVNGDGKSDVVTWFPGEKILYTSLGQESGLFTPAMGSPLTSPSAEQGNAGTVFFVADVNGDGKSDMVSWREGLGYLYCNLGQKDGTFSATIKTENYGQGRSGTKQYMADVNGDGKSDVVTWFPGENMFHTSLGQESGIFTPPIGSPMTDSTAKQGASGSIHYVTDINGDGKSDMVSWHGGPPDSLFPAGLGYLFSNLGKSDGSFTSTLRTESYGQGRKETKQYISDTNGDGRSDVITWYPGENYFYSSLGGNGNTNPTDMVTKITSPTGASQDVTYELISNLPGSMMDPLKAAYPEIANKSPRYLVTKITNNDGIDESLSHTYEYHNNKLHLGKRDEITSLGFEWIKVTDPTGKYVITYYYQEKPKVGMVKKQETYGSDNNIYLKQEYFYGAAPTKAATTNYHASYFIYLSEEKTTIYNNGGTEARYYKKAYVAHDGYGNVTRMYDYGEVDADGNDIENDKIEVVSSFGKTSRNIVVPINIKTNAYNLNGNFVLASEKKYHYLNPWGVELNYGDVSDSKGWVGQVIELSGASSAEQSKYPDKITKYEYDVHGNVIAVIDGNGNRSTMEYDSTYHTYIMKKTNPLGHAETYEYDAYNRVKKVTGRNGITSEKQYDNFNRITATIEYGDSVSAPTTKITYSALGSYPIWTKTEVKVPGSDYDYRTSIVYYDRLGRELQTKTQGYHPSQWITVDYGYDTVNRWIRKRVPYVSSTSDFTYDRYQSILKNADKTESTEYDIVGRPIFKYIPFTGGVFTGYTSSGVATLTTNNQVSYVETKGNNFINYFYDTEVADRSNEFVDTFDFSDYYSKTVKKSASNGSNITQYGDPSDTTGNTITTYLDMLGRKTSYTDPDMGTWTYEYDAVGNIVKQTDAKGQISKVEYDAIGRVIREYEGDTEIVQYWYDGLDINGNTDTTDHGDCEGRLTKVFYLDGSYSVSYYYSDSERKTTITKTINGKTRSMTSYTDSHGRIIKKVYPDGEEVVYSYNDAGGISAVSGNRAYVYSTQYTSLGSLKQMQWGNGLTTDYYYQSSTNESFIEGMTVSNLNSDKLVDLGYEYDDGSKDISKKIDNLIPENTETYTYDLFSRLISVQSGLYGIKNYSYDEFNNITNKDGKTYTYPSIGAARPHGVTGNGTYTYEYDANGNMVKRLENGVANRVIIYTNSNEVASITANGKTSTYTYDPSGQRITKNEDGITTYYFFASYEEEYKADGSLNDKTKYYSVNGLVIAQDSEVDKLTYNHRDHLGSSSLTTGSDGIVLEKMVFTPYGSTADDSDISKVYTNYQFTGQEKDENTGLYYYDARYYDPELGRFLQADTYLDGLNRYTYCGNNPVMYTDPTGHFVTFGVGPTGFSLGINIGLFGFGISVGWTNGGSVGVYGEFGPRFGCYGATIHASINYGFGSGTVFGSIGAGAGYHGGHGYFGLNISFNFDSSKGFRGGSFGLGYNSGPGWGGSLGLNVSFNSSFVITGINFNFGAGYNATGTEEVGFNAGGTVGYSGGGLHFSWSLGGSVDPRRWDSGYLHIKQLIADEKYEEAIFAAIDYFDIDTYGSNIEFAPTMDDQDGKWYPFQRIISIGPNAFRSVGYLAAVIAHESFHAWQTDNKFWYNVSNPQSDNLKEAWTYQTIENSLSRFGVDVEGYKRFRSFYNGYIKGLTDDEYRQWVSGNYINNYEIAKATEAAENARKRAEFGQ